MADVLLVEVSDRIGTLTLNRPDARNALNAELRASLPAAMRELDGRDDVDVVILTGADPAFCAGLDLRELGSTGANIRGGPRFAGEDAVMGGRLGILCQRIYDRADHPGYLEMGVPVHYGSGASEVIREVVTNPASRYKLTTESLRSGDIERALMEWRSLLRHIGHAPRLEWDRWMQLKAAAQHFIDNTTSPTTLDFPPLLAAQQRRPGALL